METGRFFSRDKASLDIFCSATKASKSPTTSPTPDVLAQKIGENLEAALEQFREIATDLNDRMEQPGNDQSR